MDAPLNYFLHSAGPATHATMVLGWSFAVIAIMVCITIALILLTAIFRRRMSPKAGRDDTFVDNQAGSERAGIRGIIIGTGISVCILFSMAVYALVTLNHASHPPVPPGLSLTVTGYDWWWKIDYGNDDPEHHFATANEIHIPVGVPILLRLNSADVIHAFWVPLLAGKTQMIPGLNNEQWLQADAAGRYRGQCTQYCGVQHAHMAIEVVAQSMPEFLAWQLLQRAALQPSLEPAAAAGQKLFIERCAACHAIRGTQAQGSHAPDLTHLLSRALIGAGLMTNTPEHLLDWIRHAQQKKPGSRMPDIALNPVEATDLAAFLSTLK